MSFSRVIDFTDYPMGHPPLMEWIKANDLDPGRLPYDQKVLVETGKLTVTEFVVKENGAKQILGGEAVTKAVTVPLKSTPAAHNLFF